MIFFHRVITENEIGNYTGPLEFTSLNLSIFLLLLLLLYIKKSAIIFSTLENVESEIFN